MRHPVCLECFGEILKQLDEKVIRNRKERDMYQEELRKLENELAACDDAQDEKLMEELAELERQEKDLDTQLADIEQQEDKLDLRIDELQESKNKVLDEEKKIWETMNAYEREHQNQLE